MKKKLVLSIVLILLAVIIISGAVFVIKSKDRNSNLDNVYSSSDFDFEFLKIENKKENMIYSPLSIRYALQMLKEGATGNTKAQIEKVIGNTGLKKHDNITDVLSLANALYIKESYSNFIKDEYKNKMINNYSADVKYDPFENANNINDWIENKTFGQIKNMLNDGDVTDPNAVMFLINALAIDMTWQEKFDVEDTNYGKFYQENGNEMNVTMMHKNTTSDSISYYIDNKITALSMDLEQYENEQMEFIAIMPKTDLSKYVENFGMDTLKKIDANLTKASKTKHGLNISIPRFSFDYELSLKEDLINLGITDAFNDMLADFSNMSIKGLYVSKALHKANIDFTEKGAKAAASTVIVMSNKSVALEEESPIEVEIDKPFMYLIRDKKTGEIWFLGTVYEPTPWGK